MASYYGTADSRGYNVRLDITQGTQDVANNTTSVSWALYATCGSMSFIDYWCNYSAVVNSVSVLSVVNTYQSLYPNNSTLLLGSGTTTVPHNADGTKTITFSGSFATVQGYAYSTVGTRTVSGSVSLTTIPRASQPTLDAASKDFGGTFTITTNWASSSFTHNLYYAFGAIGNTLIASGVGASTTWVVPTSLGSQIPVSMNGVGTITCDTYSGSTYIGTKTIVFMLTVPSSWRAVLTNTHNGFSWINSPTQLTSYIIQNISTLTLTLTASLNALVSSFGTTISAYQVRFDTYNCGEIAYSDVAVSRVSGLITVSGTQYAYFKIKDARGNWSNEFAKQVMGTGSTIYSYVAPTNNSFNVARNATVLTAADFLMNFVATSINAQNTWTYQRQYFNGSSWINIDASPVVISGYTITSTLTHSLPYVEANIYQLRVLLSDKFNTNIPYVNTLPTSDVPFVLTQYGAGIGKIPTGGGAYDLEVGIHGIRSDGPILGTISGYVPSKIRSEWLNTGIIDYIIGQLAWKNYGNNHTVFDASAGTSPSGSAVNASNAVVPWTPTYPNLMGWNGSSTYGVRVDSARVADNAPVIFIQAGTPTATKTGDIWFIP